MGEEVLEYHKEECLKWELLQDMANGLVIIDLADRLFKATGVKKMDQRRKQIARWSVWRWPMTVEPPSTPPQRRKHIARWSVWRWPMAV